MAGAASSVSVGLPIRCVAGWTRLRDTVRRPWHDPARRPGNLPADATSFIGRRRELAEVRAKLGAARLVCLVGPGGVGKTRLAIRAATGLARGFPDGAWLVELADVREPGLVGHIVMAALDLRDQAATEPSALLPAYLRDKRLLLVVDNCEHLLAAVAGLLADVMRVAPGVRVIATSREPLSTSGESMWCPCRHSTRHRATGNRPWHGCGRTRPSSCSPSGRRPPAGSFEVTDANQAAVAALCRRLDGLPLAIELAAVRTRVLTPRQVLDRLTDRFELLTAGGRAAVPRHQTLRTTIDWSHDLLSAAEQALLRRLCVFAGRFTLDDVEVVCTVDDEPAGPALDALSSLVDKSLVLKEDVKTGVLPAARDDARVRGPQAAPGRRGTGRRAALRPVLPGPVPADASAGAVPARRVARMDGPADRQHPVSTRDPLPNARSTWRA